MRPARDFRHGVTLADLPGWKKYAAQLRTLCPQITVIQTDGDLHLARLLRNPECDIVSCFPQGASIMPQWTMQTEDFRSDTSSRPSRELEDVAAIVQQATPLAGSQLELSLRTRSSQVVLPSVEAALLRVKATIRELREKQQFIATSKVLFPLESLKVLAIFLPSRPREPDIFQAAVRLAPNLECLQLYVQTHNATVSALRFLTVLAELPKVTSLRLVTNGNAACLLPSYLMHITNLELGRQVYFRQVPPKLRELCLDGLDLDYLGYDVMTSVLKQAITPISLTLSSAAIAAMPFLPEKLQKLSLQYLLHVHFSDIVRSHALHTGLARLANLRVLCIADFLTENLVYFLSGIVLPELHTLGFVWIPRQTLPTTP